MSNESDAYGVVASNGPPSSPFNPSWSLITIPSVAADRATGNIFTTYQYTNGFNANTDSSIRGALKQEGGTVGAEVVLRADDNPSDTTTPADGDPNSPDTAALSNGSYVTVYREANDNAGTSEFRLKRAYPTPLATIRRSGFNRRLFVIG